MTYCSNDPCETEAVTDRKGKAYCYTCAEAYDRGYDDGYADADKDEQ